MTDQDSSSEGFLERWSRRKAEAEREAPVASAESRSKEVSTPFETAALPANAETRTAKSPPEMPEFDLTSLPSLDSITAATDIRAFLAPGVPKEIARAALRRAWSADPAIRDFVGLAENAWDFTAPDAVAGFGALPVGYDTKKLMAQIFGENRKEADPDAAVSPTPAAPPTANTAETSAASVDAALSSIANPPRDAPTVAARKAKTGAVESDSSFVRRDNNIASHNHNSDDEAEEGKKRRPHGGALPQ